MDYKEILKNYGNDVERTLNRFGGNQNLYRKFITLFFQNEELKKMRELYNNKEYEELRMAAHTGKGIARNMGFTKLYKMLEEIVDKLHKEEYDDIGEMIEKVLDERENLKKALKEADDLYF